MGRLVSECRVSDRVMIETMSPPRDDELQPRLGCKCYQPVWWGPGQRQVHTAATAATAAFHGTDQEKGQKTGQIQTLETFSEPVCGAQVPEKHFNLNSDGTT